MSLRLGEVEKGVLKVLKRDPYIADGPKYRKLVLLYWTHIDEVVTYDQESGYYYTDMERFTEATSPEAISRSFWRLVDKDVQNLTPRSEASSRVRDEEYRAYYSEGDKNYKEE